MKNYHKEIIKLAYASISIRSDNIDISFWQNYFGINADRAFGKGDTIVFPNGKTGGINHKQGYWVYSTRHRLHDDQLDSHINFLITKFGLPRSDLPDLLARMNTAMRCLCFWNNYSSDRVAQISPHLQDILAKSGIALEIDEYPGTNNGHPWPDVADEVIP